MGCCGCSIVLIGLIVTVIAGAVFPPLGLIGIIVMFIGWKLLAWSQTPGDHREPEHKDPKIML